MELSRLVNTQWFYQNLRTTHGLNKILHPRQADETSDEVPSHMAKLQKAQQTIGYSHS